MTLTKEGISMPAYEAEVGRGVFLPLKAERIQLIFISVDESNRAYDFEAETRSERDARLETGWRKRISTAAAKNEPRRRAA